ncbi:MAG: DUF2809 domain-containing protein [Bacteroidetes bacterium]|nr:DUF2809 domain-containing protein [Bacteroidota bacterium]
MNKQLKKSLVLILSLIIIGIASRDLHLLFPTLLTRFTPDILWAAMVFALVSAVFPKSILRQRVVFALVLAYLVEISQLYQSGWVNEIRATELGGLLLGHNFAWSDIICYSLGVPLGVYLYSKIVAKQQQQPA